MGSHKAKVGHLPVPVLLVTGSNSAGISLSWALPRVYPYVSAYTVERGTDGTTFPTTVYTGSGLSTTDSFSVQSGVTYYYRVRFVDTLGKYSAYSTKVSKTQYAPVFTQAPTAATIQSTSGGTIQFTATDQDNQTLTYQILPTIPTGYSINPSTGLVTVAPGSLSASITVRVTDTSGFTATTSPCSVTVQAVSTTAHDYPRLAVMNIGSSLTVSSTERRRNVALYDMAFTGQWRRWNGGTISSGSLAGQALTIKTIADWYKELNPALKVINYTNMSNVYTNAEWAPVYNYYLSQKCGSGGDWFLRLETTVSDPKGDTISSWPGTIRTNVTSWTTPNSEGFRIPQWFSRYWNCSAGDSGSWVTSGYGVKDGNFDGIFQDDQYWIYSNGYDADYDEDGVRESKSDPDVLAKVIEAHIAYRDSWKALQPSFLFAANMSAQITPQDIVRLSPGHLGLNQIGFFENQMAYQERYQGWETMMTNHRTGLSLLAEPGIGICHATLSEIERIYAVTGLSAAKWARYFLCSSLMLNSWFAFNITGYNDAPWFDEFEHDLGAAVDAEQTSSYNSSLYGTVRMRRFANGIAIVNPKGNGSRTIALPSAGAGYKWARLSTTALTGAYVYKDAAVNTGSTASVTSVTLGEQEGLILRKLSL